MGTYSVLVQYSEEDGGYIAIIPEFPGVSAFGETPEEAVRELETAKQLTMEVYKEDGCALPEPVHLSQYSGQLRLRLPKDLHASLSIEAKRNGVSLNTHIVQLLSERNQLAKIQRELNQLKSLIATNLTALRLPAETTTDKMYQCNMINLAKSSNTRNFFLNEIGR